jgi:hypothetical protein
MIRNKEGSIVDERALDRRSVIESRRERSEKPNLAVDAEIGFALTGEQAKGLK